MWLVTPTKRVKRSTQWYSSSFSNYLAFAYIGGLVANGSGKSMGGPLLNILLHQSYHNALSLG